MYTIIFDDNTIFEGGNPENSLWDIIPEKKIKSISYWLVPHIKYEFNDFEEYCHLTERIQGINFGLQEVSRAIIMGRTGNTVYQVIFDLKRGNIYKIVVPYGQEYSTKERIGDFGNFIGWLNGGPITGWKLGIQNGTPKLKETKW